MYKFISLVCADGIQIFNFQVRDPFKVGEFQQSMRGIFVYGICMYGRMFNSSVRISFQWDINIVHTFCFVLGVCVIEIF